MAFLSIPSSWLTVGEAIKKQLFLRIKDSLDNHEGRINSLESGANKIDIFNFEVIGYVSYYSSTELVGLGTFKAPTDMILTEVGITLTNSPSTPTLSSSSGSLQIDLERSLDNGATWSTILISRPTIGDGQMNAGEVSGLVSFIDGGEVLNAGDLLRVNVTSKKDTQGAFLITTYGELS